MNKVFCTLDPHRLGDGLELSQGNLVVTTTKVCDFHRMVLGTIALGAGDAAFEAYVFSQSRPSAGLSNLSSVGVAIADCSLDKVVGEEVSADTAAIPTSIGYIPAGGLTSGGPGIHAGGSLVETLQETGERQCLGVYLSNTHGFVSFHVNGNYLGQYALTPGKFWVPAGSIGSSASPNDVAMYFNFGQRGLDYPNFWLNV